MAFPITRRAFAASLVAASQLRAAPAIPGMDQMLWDYTLEYMRLLDEKRRQRLKSIATAEQLSALQDEVRSRLAEMWGPFPSEPAPLNARTTGTLERGDYLVERLIFESRANVPVTANLYRPKGATGRLPVILCPGDGPAGKASEFCQRLCVLALRQGFAALAWDSVCQGERLQLWDREMMVSLAGGSRQEERVLGRHCHLAGLNLANYRAWDSIRAIDYLETRDDIDPARIGVVGYSGSGTEAVLLAAVEPRVKAVAAVSAVAAIPAKVMSEPAYAAEPVLPGSLRYGIDHPELLAACAPRPLMIGSPTEASFPVETARETFDEVSRLYGMVQAEGKLHHREAAGPAMNRQLREAAVDWLMRWLTEQSRSVAEEPQQLSSEDSLRCTPLGQVANDPEAAAIPALNRQHASGGQRPSPTPPDRFEFEIYKSRIVHSVRSVANVGNPRPELGIVTPDRAFEVGAFSRGEALVVAEQGFGDPRVRREVIDPLVAAGYQVVAVDLRGWGDTAPQPSELEPGFGWDDFFADQGLRIGRPLLGQRVKDLLAAAPTRLRNREWTVVGVGAGALVAAHAAVIEPRIRQLITIGGLLSYRLLLDDPLTLQPSSSFLPGVAGSYDVRDLYAATAPRRVLVINPQGSRREAAGIVAAREELDWVNQVYENLEATDNFQVHSGISAQEMRPVLVDWLAT